MSQWTSTFAYKFTSPVYHNRITKPLQVALLFTENKTVPSRKEILKSIGEPNWENKGQLSCLFTALNWNRVIEYDKKNKCYVQGERYKEYLEYSLQQMTDLHAQSKHKEEHLQLLKETSQTLHFIMEE